MLEDSSKKEWCTGLVPNKNEEKKIRLFSGLNQWRHLNQSIMTVLGFVKLRYCFLFCANRITTSQGLVV